MEQNHSAFRIGIWGHYHGGNLGDEIVVATLIHHIRDRHPEAEIVGICLDPEDTATRHGIPTISMTSGTFHAENETLEPTQENGLLNRVARGLSQSAWNGMRRIGHKMGSLATWLRVREALRHFDVLIVAGSGPLYDGWKGPWQHPYNLFRWAMLARSADVNFVPLCVGAGPLDAPLSQLFVRNALRTAYYRSFRDPGSVELIESIGVEGKNPVFPDLAFSLPEAEVTRAKRSVSPGERVIGVSTVAHEDPRYYPHGDRNRYQAYLEKLEAFSVWLVDEGYALLLLRSQVKADDRVANDLRERLKGRGVNVEKQVITEPAQTYRDLLEQIARCEVVVGGRFHCHVLPFLLDKPVLGMAYHQKTFDLMAYMGQSEYCLDIDDASVNLMMERFQRLREQRETAVETIEQRVQACRKALDFQYDLLFSGSHPSVDKSYLPSSQGTIPEMNASSSN